LGKPGKEKNFAKALGNLRNKIVANKLKDRIKGNNFINDVKEEEHEQSSQATPVKQSPVRRTDESSQEVSSPNMHNFNRQNREEFEKLWENVSRLESIIMEATNMP